MKVLASSMKQEKEFGSWQPPSLSKAPLTPWFSLGICLWADPVFVPLQIVGEVLKQLTEEKCKCWTAALIEASRGSFRG